MKRSLQIANKAFRLVLFVLLAVTGQSTFAQPTVLGTSIVSGTYSTTNLTTVGGFKQVRLQATSSAATGVRVWEFATGTAASTNYTTNWRPYTGNNTISTNTFIPTSFANGAKYNTGGGGASGLLPAITSGSYYTFNVSNNSAADNVMSILATTYNPVTITGVTSAPGSGVTNVTVTTSAVPAENIFVRYSTDGYATSTIVQASGASTTLTAAIPIMSGTISYYVYSSNRTLSNINTDVTSYGQSVHDMSTLNLNNNGGANYTFANTYIATNDITAADPSTSNPFTTGQLVVANATASGITRSSALTASSASNRFSATNWPTAASVDATKYFEFTITPNSGYRLNFTNFAFSAQASSVTTSPMVVLRSSVNGYATDISTPIAITTSAATYTISLTAASFQGVTTPITFRYYIYGLPATTTTSSINDYTFYGTVDAVPAVPVLAISGSTTHGTVCPNVSATPITYTITNTGTVTATGVTVVSSDPQFVVSGLSSTTIASGGGTATYVVTFTPSSAGAKTATITVASATSGSNSPTSALTGTGATPATQAVTSAAATAVNTSSATLNGNLTTIGVCPATIEKGFVYAQTATNSNPQNGGTGVTKTPVSGITTGAYTLGLTGLSPATSYTYQAYVYNGATYTYGGTISFTTLAAADHLAFVGVPASGTTGSNLTSFTLEARRPDNTVDNTYTSNVTISKASGPGALSGTLTVAAVAGVATFSAAQFDTVGTVTLAANSGSLTAAASGNIVISLAPVALWTNPITGTNPNTNNPYTTGQTVSTNITVSGIGRGTGIISANANDRYSATGWDSASLDANDYFSFTLTANTGYTISLNNFTYTGQASGTGPTNFAFRSSADNYVSNIGIPTATGTTISLTAATYQNVSGPITFRIYGWGASAAAGTFSVNDFTFSGNVTCLDPIAYNVTGGGTTCSGTGLPVGLSNSQTGINYQLQLNGVNSGSPVAGTGAAISFGSPTAAGTYTVVASNTNGTCNLTLTMTGNAVIIVNPTSVAGTVSANQTICSGSQPANITLTGSTGTIQWQNSTDGITFTNIAGQTNATLSGASIGNLTATMYYRAIVTSGVCSSATSATVTITVNPTSVAGTVSANQTICSGSQPANITLTGNTGTIQWQNSTDAITFTNIAGQTSATLSGASIGNLTATMYYRAIVTSGVCSSATSATVTITVNPTSLAGTVSANQTICSGAQPANITLTGNTGTIQWQNSTDAITFTNIAGQTSATLSGSSIGNLTATMYYRAIVTSGVCSSTTSATVTITVNPTSVAGTVSANQTICSGSQPANITLTGNTGTIQWQNSTDAITFTNIAGQTSATLSGASIGNLTATMYYRAIVTSGVCSSATSSVVTVTVTPGATAGTVSADQAICAGTQPGNITITGSTGTIQWQSSTDNVSFTDIAGATSATLTSAQAGNLSATTYFRAIVTSGACGSATSAVVTVTISSTTWDGTAWSNGVPTSTTSAIFTGNYTSAGDLSACTVTVTNNASVTILSNDDVNLNGALTVGSGSTFTLNNNANLLQATNATNSGNIVVKRNSSALLRQDYTLWSSPVTGQNLLSFSPATLTNRFYTYDSSINLYSVVSSPGATNFNDAQGYLIRVPNTHPATTPTIWPGVFTGVAHNGTYNFTMYNGGNGLKFNAVGNPYPSPINMTAFVSANSSAITGTLYFWRKTNNAMSPSYCSWTAGTFTSNGEAQVFDPNNIIRTGQGFFVEAAGAATALTFNNAMRSGDNANQFFRTSQDVDKSRIWLNATGDGGLFSQMALVYVDGAISDGLDMYDGRYINDGPIALNSVVNDSDYVIQGRAPFVPSDIVPLHFTATAAGTYTIAIDHLDGLFSGSQDIFLKDNLLNVTHDLRTAAYTFASEAGTFASRFELVYQNTLAVNQLVFNDNSVVIYKQGGDFVINSGTAVMDHVQVFDVRGRLVAEKSAINASETKINAGTTNEVLVVKIISVDHTTVTKKVVN